MYKKDFEKAQKIVLDATNEGKEALILGKLNDTTLYPMKEHISIVKNIEKTNSSNGMVKLTLQFKNIEAVTVAYIDSSIRVGTVVSTIGFLLKECGSWNYYCKGGINPLFNTIEDIMNAYFAKPYHNKIYRMGLFLELSQITEETDSYYTYDSDVKPLPDVERMYYVIREIPKDNTSSNSTYMFNRLKGNTNPKTIDTSTLPDVSEEEDYPDDDVDTTIDLEENNDNE